MAHPGGDGGSTGGGGAASSSATVPVGTPPAGDPASPDRGVANGIGAADGARLSAAFRVVRVGKGSSQHVGSCGGTIAGHLMTADGQPIRQAALVISGLGFLSRTVTTTAAGRFSLRWHATRSSNISISYTAWSRDGRSAAARTLHLRVRSR